MHQHDVGLKLPEKETHLKRLIVRVVKSGESRGERMPVFDRYARGAAVGGGSPWPFTPTTSCSSFNHVLSFSLTSVQFPLKSGILLIFLF